MTIDRSVYRKETIKISKGADFDERVATFSDGFRIVISEGWTRLGGHGWLVAGLTAHTCRSMRKAAIDGRKAFERIKGR